MCAPLGLHPPSFFPERAGRDYALTRYLDVVKEFRNDFTVISGLSHPDTGPTHDSQVSFLTAAPHPENRAGFRNSISVDQVAAQHIGAETRFPSLVLGCEGSGLSWTRSGAIVPADCWPTSVFGRLFLEGRPEDVQAQTRRLHDGRSILDTVRDRALRIRPALDNGDREKLDEYFTSVRELEQHLARTAAWSRRPKPRVNVPPPQNNNHPSDMSGKARLMFDLIHLALQTDSTRLITLQLLGTSGVPPVAGVSQGHHDLSHHGQDPTKIEQLQKIEMDLVKTLRGFLAKLKQTRERDATLLDRSTIFFSSNLGNAASHSTRNLPVLLAGGGFRHGQHLAFNPANPPPLSNLFVSMLQRLGIQTNRFGSSTGTLTGLELV
jgi:hypothetical protein